MYQAGHIPVLLDAVLAALRPASGETYADATAGLGGHARAIAQAMGTGTIILNDVDPANLQSARTFVQAQAPGCTVHSERGNFAELPHALLARRLPTDMLLADLGFSSNQIEDSARGLSFMRDGPLDMRLDPNLPVHAGDLVNTLTESDLTRLLLEFGEERAAPRIARKLVAARAQNPIATTAQLAELVRAALGSPGGPIDPATRTFQALRIAVNDELGSLQGLLGLVEQAARTLAQTQRDVSPACWARPGCRVAIISFHSLEDRFVKQCFSGLIKQGVATDVSGGLAVASSSELAANPRARSAKLRVIALA